MDEYEDFVITTDVRAEEHNLEFYLDGFREEVGEVSGVLKRIRRGDYGEDCRSMAKVYGLSRVFQSFHEPLIDFLKEFGDSRWYATRALQEIGQSWADVDRMNMAKLKKRLETKTIVGKGDAREENIS